jgi:RHS repeat-associated protein
MGTRLAASVGDSYIYGPHNRMVEQISSGGTITYLHHDQQDSTRLMTGSTGTSTGRFTYDSYGNQTGHTGTTTTPLGYDGQYTSSDTGLIYLRARVYDPTTAQFLSVDPAAASTRAPYNYASDNPLSSGDPSGLCNEDTGLIYLRARVYDPATAQFLTVDTIASITRAPYNYAGDNPVNAADRAGLSSWNPFSESFWTEGNVISESPLNRSPTTNKRSAATKTGADTSHP